MSTYPAPSWFQLRMTMSKVKAYNSKIARTKSYVREWNECASCAYSLQFPEHRILYTFKSNAKYRKLFFVCFNL